MNGGKGSRQRLAGRIGVGVLVMVASALVTPGQTQVFQRWAARIDVAHQSDQAKAITSDRQLNIYVAGGDCTNFTFKSPSQPCNPEMLLEKYNNAGQRLWGASLKSPGGFTEASAVTTDDSGNVFVTGVGLVNADLSSGTANKEFITIKYNSDGARQWIAVFPGGSFSGPARIRVDSQGNSYITGLVAAKGSELIGPATTIKYDPNGHQLWTAELNVDISNGPSGLVLDESGSVYVTGTSSDNGVFFQAGFTVKYDTTGREVWRDVEADRTKTFNSFSNNAIALDAVGNVLVAGEGSAFDDSSSPHPGIEYVIKYTSGGKRLWTETYQTPNAAGDVAQAIVADANGNSYVTGWTAFPSGQFDFSTLKIDATGHLKWVRRFNGTGTGRDFGMALALNGEADVYVTGSSTSPNGSGQDYATLKYESDGTPLWSIRYNGPGKGDDTPNGIVLAGSAVVVTGSSEGSATSQDWATVAYVQDADKVTPGSLTFGSQTIGTISAQQILTVTNTDDETPLAIKTITVSGDFKETNDCPLMLGPGATCSIRVIFQPTTKGIRMGTVSILDQWAGSPQQVPLTGIGN
jgi:hypothetical protein